MNKLWCDLKTDAEKADYILSGKAYAAGVISHMIQADVAMAFTKCANYAAEISRLREENERLRKEVKHLKRYEDAIDKCEGGCLMGCSVLVED